MTEKNNYPGIEHVFVLFILLVAVMMIFSIPIISYYEDFYLSNRYIIVPFLTLFSTGIVFFIGFKKSKMKFADIIKPDISSYPLFILVVISTFGLTIVLSEFNNIFRYFSPMPETTLNSFIGFLTSGNIFSVILSIGIVIPVAEEFLFRGLFLKGLMKSYSAPFSIITSSVLFAVFHVNPWGLFSYFCVGVFLSWIFLKTDNLIYSIAAHSAYNLWVVIFINAEILIPGFSDLNKLDQFQPFWFDLLGIMIFCLCFFLMSIVFKKQPLKGK